MSSSGGVLQYLQSRELRVTDRNRADRNSFSGGAFPNSQFGKITTLVGTPRQVQLALKLVS
jgi:hypothetical protein